LDGRASSGFNFDGAAPSPKKSLTSVSKT
jgi:hypothetical protein